MSPVMCDWHERIQPANKETLWQHCYNLMTVSTVHFESNHNELQCTHAHNYALWELKHFFKNLIYL